MANTIILTENQLKRVIKAITESGKRKMKTGSGMTMDDDEQELVMWAMDEYGISSPKKLYDVLIRDRQNAENFSSLRAIKLSQVIGILEYYWYYDKPEMYSSPKRNKMDDIEPEQKPEEKKPSFSDRFRINRGDLTKFRDE